MSSCAVLGATGNCGHSLVEILSQDQHRDHQIHAYARSKAKLLKQFPGLEEDPRFKIFEGKIDDTQLIANCISGTKATFLAVAASDNMPGCAIAQQTAQSVLNALEYLRAQDPKCSLPRLVVLDSASTDEHLSRFTPKLAHNVALAAFSHIYADLREAEKLLRANGAFVKTTFVKPGGLVHDVQGGHEISDDHAPAQSFLSFLDLAAGMVEVGQAEDDKWEMKSVSVLPKSQNVKFERGLPLILGRGLLFHFFPWLWPWIMG